MDIIRFSILLSLLLFGAYANHTAEKSIMEGRSNYIRLDSRIEGITEENYAFMRRALDIHTSVTETNQSGLSASLIVKDGKVVGEGWDKSKLLTDPSAHATVTAVREASKNMGMESLKGCILYSTAELCPMCLSLLYVADIDKVIYSIPSEEGPSVEALMSKRIYEALGKKIGERPIPEIFVPYQMLDSDIHSATDGTEN